MAHPMDALTPILDTALDAVVVMRSDGTVSGWNAVAEKVFGWSGVEAIGQQPTTEDVGKFPARNPAHAFQALPQEHQPKAFF